MDSKRIVELKDNGIKVKDDPAARDKFKTFILEVFIKNGVHRSMSEERFNEEVLATSTMLYKDILEDSKFSYLRTDEVRYCFDNGIKGRLGKNDAFFTYSTLVRWIEAYVNSTEYRSAVKELTSRPLPPSQQIESHKLRDDDIKKTIKDAYNDYLEYVGRRGIKRNDIGVPSMTEIIGLPISCRDFGGIKTKWLCEKGFANDGETLVQYFERIRFNSQNNLQNSSQ